MNRRFNSTGRAKIARDKITIRVVDDGADGQSKFTADLSGLAELAVDATARVIIEPYVQQSSMRFDFGSFGNIVSPYDTTLAEIDRGAPVQFRIKVVDTLTKPGRLLAVADQIRPVEESDDDDRKSILPLRFTDLGEAVWRIVVAADEPPVLEVNSRITDIGNRLTIDPLLRGAIFPVAIREVLRIVLSEEADTERDWVREWRQFAAGLLREPLDEDTFEPDVTRDLIERVVEKFCERERWATLAQAIDVPLEENYE